MLIGYGRTSTFEQKAGLEAQDRDLRAAGCERVFLEQVSSVDTAARSKLAEALDFAREGDTLICTKLDRLARSVADLVRIRDRLRDKGVSLRILALGIDTATPTGSLMMNLLGSIAEFEREIMLERQREGIAKAKAEGRYKGRPATAQAKAEDARRLHADGVGASEIARRLGIGRTSVYRALAGKGPGVGNREVGICSGF